MSIEPDRQEDQRRSLAEALRSLRQASGLSGVRLAARCNMSQSKISRIETGRVLPTVVDVERILRALEVDSSVSQELLNLTRLANVDYRSSRSYAKVGLWRKQDELRALTEMSRTVRHFLPAIPTGLLQVPDYARSVLSRVVSLKAERDVEKIVQARQQRQAVLDDPRRTFFFLMTEQAVRWRQADSEVMVRQLSHMADLVEKPSVEIGIILQSTKVLEPPMNIFVVYDDRLVTVELFSGEVALRDPQEIAYHLELFEFFLGHAIRGEEASEFLRSVARDFMR
ncbi:Helix-turn-helix domain-containing protein [Streptoalloteichus tenebrarius]|uniref:Helix-turn-helix domain-containing protein n=1 Tax=Streptoalloteichus tenebrarius (strain ATCC 17920 / DSM 40477 / JCM 4838 / CBS 697.72 / NBRC 16177 / NCIMB 11028 / NRRL B-12390 / A12253. 1 / ISP 5477) TaxID=1933 RepID=A0ABT1HQI9_STRSD|nr:helix-turn-helix transcriptional regulator [Streptoalloteichus tenebrarius]MCP2257781.1 Helix-turn-helix domain-containing protein [Streptoalloteichus tenebrarius]BFE99859.1 helix-turn-helix transcriptional regulator [Streptoalloteichus tenebrarius]